MKNKKLDVIVCPVCGREYLPAEIYVRKAMLGNPDDIQRDSNGKITTFDNQTMNLNESFVCDGCLNKFYIHGAIKFDTTVNPEEDFSTDYVSPLHEKKLSLFED